MSAKEFRERQGRKPHEPTRLTAEEGAELLEKGARRSKFNNTPTEISDGGKKAGSGWEAVVVESALFYERQGWIGRVQRQVPFHLIVNGRRVGGYIADLTFERDGRLHVVDAKGATTDLAQLKLNLMRACYGIRVALIRREHGAAKILELK